MIVYFACRLSTSKKHIVVRADDADVFILLLHHSLRMSKDSIIFMDMGLSSKNNWRYHNMSAIAASLGPKVLVHFHPIFNSLLYITLSIYVCLCQVHHTFCYYFQICAALPAFHAFTGCDYTAAFSRCNFLPSKFYGKLPLLTWEIKLNKTCLLICYIFVKFSYCFIFSVVAHVV